MSERLKKMIKAIVWAVGGVMVFFTALSLSFEYFASQWRVGVSSTTAKEFPVVLIASEGPEIVLLNEFQLEKGDEGTYFVEPIDLESINAQLRLRHEVLGRKGIPQITVRETSDEVQIVDLEIHTDGIFRSTYEARRTSVRPLHYTITGPLFIFLSSRSRTCCNRGDVIVGFDCSETKEAKIESITGEMTAWRESLKRA